MQLFTIGEAPYNPRRKRRRTGNRRGGSLMDQIQETEEILEYLKKKEDERKKKFAKPEAIKVSLFTAFMMTLGLGPFVGVAALLLLSQMMQSIPLLMK